MMAPLSPNRLRLAHRAIEQIGAGNAGPITTIQGRGKTRQKRWLKHRCVFERICKIHKQTRSSEGDDQR